MKVLLTGATGYIGRVVAEKLKLAGHEVVGLARSDEAAQRLRERGHAVARGDISEPHRVAALARDVDAVVLAATTNDARNAEYEPRLVRALLGALEGTGRALVFTSGVWSLGPTGEETADEAWKSSPLPLVAHREPLEREVLAAASRGVRALVVRPAIVYGRGAGIPSLLVAEARAKGGVRVIGDGRQEWPVVHVDDLAELYLRALASGEAGSLFHGTDGQHRARDVALAASLGAGAGGRLLPCSLEEARGELGGFGEFFALHQRVSSLRTRRRLGWTPRGPSLVEELLTGSYVRSA